MSPPHLALIASPPCPQSLSPTLSTGFLEKKKIGDKRSSSYSVTVQYHFIFSSPLTLMTKYTYTCLAGLVLVGSPRPLLLWTRSRRCTEQAPAKTRLIGSSPTRDRIKPTATRYDSQGPSTRAADDCKVARPWARTATGTFDAATSPLAGCRTSCQARKRRRRLFFFAFDAASVDASLGRCLSFARTSGWNDYPPSPHGEIDI